MTMFFGGAIAAVGGGSNIIIGVFIAACSSVRFIFYDRGWLRWSSVVHAYLTL